MKDEHSLLEDLVAKKIESIKYSPIFALSKNKKELSDKVLNTYLDILNEDESVFKINKTYTCDTCMSFVNKIGDKVWFDENGIHTIWEIDPLQFETEKFQILVKKLHKLVLKAFKDNNDIEYHFYQNSSLGAAETPCIKEYDDGRVEHLTFTHLHGKLSNHHVAKNGGFQKFYRYSEAMNLMEKATELKSLVDAGIHEQLFEEIPKLKTIYGGSIDNIVNFVTQDIKLFYIERSVKFSNLLFTCMLKVKEDGFDAAVKFAKFQLRADKFMQEKAKGNNQIMKEFKELQSKNVVYTGLQPKSLEYNFVNNRYVGKKVKGIVPKDIKIKDFKAMLDNTEVFEASVLISGKIDARGATLLEPKPTETKVSKDSVVVFKNGLTDIFESVKKHGGKVNSKYVFSLLFGKNADPNLKTGRGISDLDLHLRINDSCEIMYSSKYCDELKLDVDMKVSDDNIIDPIENIHGNHLEDGEYRLFVIKFTSRKHKLFKIAFKNDYQIYETEVINPSKLKTDICIFRVKNGSITNIDWKVGIKNNALTPKELIHSEFNSKPIYSMHIDDRHILFDIGKSNTFETTGINKEMLLPEYQRYNQTLSLMSEKIVAPEYIGYGFHELPIININNTFYRIVV